MSEKKIAVMYGAGSIGRGFIGQLFSLSQYEVVFIDVNSAVVDKLNQDKGYVLELVTAEKTEKTFISPVRAVNGLDQNAVACEIAQAEIMATAVGVNILPKIAENIAAGIRLRMEQGKGPLNIIICENLINADEYLKELIERYLSEPEQAYFHENIGLLEASVGRMVPLLSREQVDADPTRVVAEPYDKLPVKSDFIKGELPKIEGVIPFSPFEFYIERKLFVHNMAHAVCAYMGAEKGYEYIDKAIQDEEIRSVVAGAMREIDKALSVKYGISEKELTDFTDDLLVRFANPVLMDTVARVGRDVVRKLKRNDRLVGAALCCLASGVEPDNIIRGILAAIAYRNDEDETTLEISKEFHANGLAGVLKKYCGLTEGDPLYTRLMREVQNGKL